MIQYQLIPAKMQGLFANTDITNLNQKVSLRCYGKGQREECSTIEPLLESADDEYSRTLTQIMISLVAFMGSCDVLCALSITYIYKDDIKISPAWISFVLSIPRVGWTIKPLLCVFSDNYPIFGSRRKSYMIIGCLINLISSILIALYKTPSFIVTTILLGTWNLGSALCSVAGEALVVEVGRHKDDSTAMNQVSIYFAFKRISISIMAYCSSIALLYMKPKDIFWIASFIPMITLVGILLITEPSKYNMVPNATIYEQYRSIKTILTTSRVYNPILFLFIRSMAPSSAPAMFYFMTEKLHFTSEIFGRANLFQCFASLVAIYLFNKYMQNCNLRRLLLWSTVLTTPFCLMSIVVVERWNLTIGIPDTVFVITDNIICEFVSDFQCIPIMILTSRLCPKGMESTVNSTIITILHHGIWMGSIFSAAITMALGVTSTNFDNLKWLVIISSTSHLLPILMINMLPNTLPSADFVDNMVSKMSEDDLDEGFEDDASIYGSQKMA